MSEAAKWYVIHTYSGYENKVAQDIEKAVEYRQLHDLIQEVRVPTEKVTEITDGKEKVVEHKVFPSYVLLKMVYTGDTWHVIKDIRGVTGFVGFVSGTDPIPLSDAEVAALGINDAEDSEEITGVTVDYQVGDTVEISGTSMNGMRGIVKSIDLDNNDVEVIVHLMGRETSAHLSLKQVIRVDD